MKKKILAFALALVLIIALVPGAAFGAFSDTTGHPASSAIDRWASRKVLNGYPDGTFKPDGNITRAEFAAVVDRVFKYKAIGENKFSDLGTGWHTDYILHMVAAGIMQGDTPTGGTVRPKANITREEAFAMLCRAFELTPNAGGLSKFEDSGAISEWAKPEVGAMAPYIAGNNLRAKDLITRAEVVTTLDSLVKGFYNAKATVNSTTEGNAVVNVQDVTFDKAKVNGNLYITQGVGTGDFTLKDSNVSGTMFVNGGGRNTIRIIGSTVKEVKAHVDPITGTVRIFIDEKSVIETVYVEDGSYDVILEGTLKNVVVEGGTKVTVAAGTTVESVSVTGDGVTVDVSSNATVKAVTVDASTTTITGAGRVETVNVKSGTGNSVTTAGTRVTVAAGAGAVSTGSGKTIAPGSTGTSETASGNSSLPAGDTTGGTGSGGGIPGGGGYVDDDDNTTTPSNPSIKRVEFITSTEIELELSKAFAAKGKLKVEITSTQTTLTSLTEDKDFEAAAAPYASATVWTVTLKGITAADGDKVTITGSGLSGIGSDAFWAGAVAFKTAYKNILALAGTGVNAGNKDGVKAMLTAYKTKRTSTAPEFSYLETKLGAKIFELEAAWFKVEHAEILGKTKDTIISSDLPFIDAALDDIQNLENGTRPALTTEIEKINSFKKISDGWGPSLTVTSSEDNKVFTITVDGAAFKQNQNVSDWKITVSGEHAGINLNTLGRVGLSAPANTGLAVNASSLQVTFANAPLLNCTIKFEPISDNVYEDDSKTKPGTTNPGSCDVIVGTWTFERKLGEDGGLPAAIFNLTFTGSMPTGNIRLFMWDGSKWTSLSSNLQTGDKLPLAWSVPTAGELGYAFTYDYNINAQTEKDLNQFSTGVILGLWMKP